MLRPNSDKITRINPDQKPPSECFAFMSHIPQYPCSTSPYTRHKTNHYTQQNAKNKPDHFFASASASCSAARFNRSLTQFPKLRSTAFAQRRHNSISEADTRICRYSSRAMLNKWHVVFTMSRGICAPAMRGIPGHGEGVAWGVAGQGQSTPQRWIRITFIMANINKPD